MIDHHQFQHHRTHSDRRRPIEYVLRHKRCVVNQREVGHDTKSYENALANALREAPDLLLIGEVRDRATMQHALTHALTGNLCLTTLHATNSYHALSRIINMYPQDARSGLSPISRTGSRPSSASDSSRPKTVAYNQPSRC